MKKQNLQNDKTNINFMWLYDFKRLIATEKIIKGEKIEMHDIIPNNEEKIEYIEKYGKNKGKEEIQYDTTFFLQSITSWAINFPENPARIVIQPMYSYMLNDEDIKSVFEIQNLDERQQEIKKLCEQRVQEKYSTAMTLQEIEEKYDECFKNFETELKKHNNNFSIIKFKDLANQYLKEEEIEKDDMLRYLLKEDCVYIEENTEKAKKFLLFNVEKKTYSVCRNMGCAIDAMRVALNYYGLGYEKNLTIDMDYSINCIKISCNDSKGWPKSQIDVDKDTIDNIKQILKKENILMPPYGENSCLYSSTSRNPILTDMQNALANRSRNSWKRSPEDGISIWGLTDRLSKSPNQPAFVYINRNPNLRTFDRTLITQKTDLPIIFEKDFWPEEEFLIKMEE